MDSNVIFRHIFIYTFTYMHEIMINEKRSCELEGECGLEYRRAWREQREGKMLYSLFQKEVSLQKFTTAQHA